MTLLSTCRPSSSFFGGARRRESLGDSDGAFQRSSTVFPHPDGQQRPVSPASQLKSHFAELLSVSSLDTGRIWAYTAIGWTIESHVGHLRTAPQKAGSLELALLGNVLSTARLMSVLNYNSLHSCGGSSAPCSHLSGADSISISRQSGRSGISNCQRVEQVEHQMSFWP